MEAMDRLLHELLDLELELRAIERERQIRGPDRRGKGSLDNQER